MRTIDNLIRCLGPRAWEAWDRELIKAWRTEVDIPDDALFRAIHLHTTQFYTTDEEGLRQSYPAEETLDSLPCIVPPWPITFVECKCHDEQEAGEREEAGIEATLVFAQQRGDGGFTLAVFTFYDGRFGGPPTDRDCEPGAAALIHLNRDGRWEVACDAGFRKKLDAEV